MEMDEINTLFSTMVVSTSRECFKAAIQMAGKTVTSRPRSNLSQEKSQLLLITCLMGQVETYMLFVAMDLKETSEALTKNLRIILDQKS